MELPKNRKCHVARIFGTNAAGDVLTHIWVDVLRIDELKITTQDAVHQFNFTNQWQEVTLRLKWQDDEGQQNEEIETRTLEIVKVCGPDEDHDNPTEWVPVHSIKTVHFRATDIMNNRKFLDRTLTSDRTMEPRKITHRDTNIDDTAEKSGQKIYVVPFDDYVMDNSTIDEDDFVDHEIVTKLKGRSTPHWIESPGGDDHKITTRFRNEFLIDEFGPAEGDDLPVRLDVFQNIINCKLGGIAVEFEKDEYVSSNTSSYSEALVSFWVRTPAASLAAIDSSSDDALSGYMPLVILSGTVPVGSGPRTTSFLPTVVSSGGFITAPYMDYISEPSNDKQPKPSFIGINKSGNLTIVLQTPVRADFQGYDFDAVGSLAWFLDDPDHPSVTPQPGDGYGGFAFLVIWSPSPSDLGGSVEEPIGVRAGPATLAADRWHHVLVSFDVSAGISANASSSFGGTGTVDGSYKIYAAVDDVNQDAGGNYGDDTPNDFVPSEADRVRLINPNIDNNYLLHNHFVSAPAFAAGSGRLQSGAVGIPTTSQFSSHSQTVEMADFRMWTGIVRDTANVNLRRLFIDDKGKPVPKGAAEDVLGKPTIAFYTQKDWKNGRNAGSGSGFSAFGEIESWSPDPTLHGRQSPR